MNRNEKWQQFYERMHTLSIWKSDAEALRRIEMTLHRWAERECNGEVERDETTNKTYSVSASYLNGIGEYKRFPCPDRESGALKRLAEIMEQFPELVAYHQTDPRGCALYIVRKSDIREGEKLSSVYTRGVAVCL